MGNEHFYIGKQLLLELIVSEKYLVNVTTISFQLKIMSDANYHNNHESTSYFISPFNTWTHLLAGPQFNNQYNKTEA